jgi:hypothetical protein
MEGLKALAGSRKLLLVGDSKLISRGNVLAMNTARVALIAPAGKAYLPATHLRALDLRRPRRSTTSPNATRACRLRGGAPIGWLRAASP